MKEYDININGLNIHITKKKIKNINLYIKTLDGKVVVTAPMRVSDEYIKSFILRKWDWIIKHRERVIKSVQQLYGNSYKDNIDGADKETSSQKEINSQNKIIISDEELQLLKDKIREYANKWEPVIGVKCECFTIRMMKTRWGSCSVNKHTIRINSLLVKKPEKCLELVIVHELVHMLEPGHNKVFKDYMTRFLPDWKQTEKLLKESC